MRSRQQQVRGSSGQLCKLRLPPLHLHLSLFYLCLNKFCDRNKTRPVACEEKNVLGRPSESVCVHSDALFCEKTTKIPLKTDGQSQQFQVPSGTSCLHYPRPPLPLLIFPAAGMARGQRLGRATRTHTHSRRDRTGKECKRRSAGGTTGTKVFFFLFFPLTTTVIKLKIKDIRVDRVGGVGVALGRSFPETRGRGGREGRRQRRRFVLPDVSHILSSMRCLSISKLAV